ncbi:hypothetical protein [Pseudomonas syringae]|uniref:hypothetical protein n=1 Tax=Pseudomonas syringae TaxID=317 RepID=UPI0016050174|nr:hypothetical protein [Pseudomonas syringae]
MALTQKQRDERTALKRQKAGEEEFQLRVRPDALQMTSQAKSRGKQLGQIKPFFTQRIG